MFSGMKFFLFTGKSLSDRHVIIIRKLLTRHGATVYTEEDIDLLNKKSQEQSQVNSKLWNPTKNTLIHSNSNHPSHWNANHLLQSHPWERNHPWERREEKDSKSLIESLASLHPDVLDFIIAEEKEMYLFNAKLKEKVRTRNWISECVRSGSVLPLERMSLLQAPEKNLSTQTSQRRSYSTLSSESNDPNTKISKQMEELDEGTNSNPNHHSSRNATQTQTNKQTRVEAPSISDLNPKGSNPQNLESYNDLIIKQLDELRNYYHLLGDKWRAFAFQKAVSKVRNYPHPITKDTPLETLGLGEKTQQKVEEMIRLNKCTRLESLENDERVKSVSALSKIWGVGGKTASTWYDAMNIRSISDLKEAFMNGKVKLTSQQQIGLKYYDDLQHRIPREEVAKIEAYVKKIALAINPHLQIVTCGSYRRGLPTSGDVDILITATKESHDPFPSDIIQKIVYIGQKTGFISACLGGSYSKDIHLEDEFLNMDLKPFEMEEDLPQCEKNAHSENPCENGLSSTKASKISNEGINSPSIPKTTNQSSASLGFDDISDSQNNTELKNYQNSIDLKERDEYQVSKTTTHHSFMGICKLPSSPYHRRIDIKVYHPDVFPFALLYFTGSDHFNRKMRYIAHHMGLSLSDTSICEVIRVNGKKIEGRKIPCETEEDIFKVIGMEYHDPKDRCL